MKTATDQGKNLWIGFSDRGQQGAYRRVSDGVEYTEDLNKPSLAYWGLGDPDMEPGKDCLDIHDRDDEGLILNDADCSWRNHPYGNPYFGICEIAVYKCIP